MRRFAALRLLQAIPLIIASTMLTFFAVSVAGDPLARYRQPNVPESVLTSKAAELGLDRPLPERYWNWITSAVHGDLGLNDQGRSVGHELITRSLVSFRLIAAAMVIAIVLAIAVGFFSAIRRNTWTDRVLIGITILLLTAPEFWIAVVLKQGTISLQQATGTDFVSTVGESSPRISEAPFFDRIGDYAGHLLLPTIVLVLTTYPVWALYQRSSMVEVLDSDYIRMARAKGLSRSDVLVRHGLRNALMPTITMVALRLPWVIGGLVVVETIFGWRGLGVMLVEGIQKQDTNTVLAFMLLTSVMITVLNLGADIAHRYLDPRVRDA